jgi:WD40 repeat protein
VPQDLKKLIIEKLQDKIDKLLTVPVKKRELLVHSNRVTSVVMSRNGKYTLTGSLDKHACLWDLATGALINQLKTFCSVISVAFVPDSNNVIVGRFAPPLIWNFDSGQVTQLEDFPCSEKVALSANGKYAIMGGLIWSGVCLCDLKSYKLIENFKVECKGSTAVAISADNKHALISKYVKLGDIEVCLWDIQAGFSKNL